YMLLDCMWIAHRFTQEDGRLLADMYML
ncbi:MAG: hypothetical protein RL521_1295, partial [Bacteroidota bacterium]